MHNLIISERFNHVDDVVPSSLTMRYFNFARETELAFCGVLNQKINIPMRSIGTASSENIKIGMNRTNAMTARMQIHTIHMK